MYLNNSVVIFDIDHAAFELVRCSSCPDLRGTTLCSHIVASQPIEVGPEAVVERIPAGHTELYFPGFGDFAVLIDELDIWVSQNKVRLVREAIVCV